MIPQMTVVADLTHSGDELSLKRGYVNTRTDRVLEGRRGGGGDDELAQPLTVWYSR
jgi:hypothetical protein